MRATDLIVEAMDHVTILDEGTINIPHWISVVIDKDVPVPMASYSVDACIVEAAFKGSYLRSVDDNGQTSGVIPAGEYSFVDPDDDYYETAVSRRSWPLSLRDVSRAEFKDRDDGGTYVNLPPVELSTHRDATSRHVSVKSMTILDALIYLAADDAKRDGRRDDAATLLSLVTPYYGSYLSDEQEREILDHLHEHRRMPVIRSGKVYTDAQGASTKQSLSKLDNGLSATFVGSMNELIIKSTDGNIPIVADAGVMMTLTQINAIIMSRQLKKSDGGGLTVSMTYDDLLGPRGREDTKKNRARIRSQINALRNSAWMFKDDGDDYDIGVMSSRVFRRNGTIAVNMTPEFMKVVIGNDAGLMPFNERMFLVNYDEHRHAWGIGYKLQAHTYMNWNKPNQCRIGVKALLRYLKTLPPSEDVQSSGGRNYTRNIMKPMKNDLDYLRRIGVIRFWKYVHSGGADLTSDERSEVLDREGVLKYDHMGDFYIEWELSKVDIKRMEARGEAREDSQEDIKKVIGA